MIIALLLAAAAPMSAIEAERAFAADAQKLGQWTAFRKWAARDAVMFVPQRVNAQAWLKDKKDPPLSVFWWPGRSYVSCDGTVAVNTGPWVREFGKSVGYFTTVWVKQGDGGWKWIYDSGDELKFARDEGGDIAPINASCGGRPNGMPHSAHSPDRTIFWNIDIGPQGQRSFIVGMWDGADYQMVIDDRVAPPSGIGRCRQLLWRRYGSDQGPYLHFCPFTLALELGEA